MSQSFLFIENFDVCRICLTERHTDGHEPFVPITTLIDGKESKELIFDWLKINIKSDNGLPNMICKCCSVALDNFHTLMKTANESYIVLDYIAKKRVSELGRPVPETSVASTSSLMIINNEESSHPMPGTSEASTSTVMLRNNEVSSQEPPLKIDKSDESDDDSCIITSPPIDTVVLLSDDDSCIITSPPIDTVVLLSDDDSCIITSPPIDTVVLLSDDEIDELSSDSEDNENNTKTEKLYYCSICQKKNILNHDCSQHTKSFFTCLVPGCNILSRSKKDFTFHYQPHIGMCSSGVMCHRCFKGIDQSRIDGNGCHICDIENAFRCYLCNIRFKSIQEFAHHKLKTHNGILMDAHYNYLCLHCEESSPDIQEINDHMDHCLESRAKNETAASMKPKKETELLPVKVKENVMVRTNGNNNMIPRTSQHLLFTCLKPSCNLIFLSFTNFKIHHRHHFELGNALVCWQCYKPCSDLRGLRAHQIINNCRTLVLYNCYSCSSKFDDLESLSIHKLTFHESKLIASKKNRKTLVCAFCQMDINILNFKSHLVTCRKKDVKQNTCTTKNKGEYTCLTCEKVFMSSISLSNHSRVHKQSQISNFKQEST